MSKRDFLLNGLHEKVMTWMSVPKWSFAFLQRNAKFYSCTQTAIRYFTAKYEILRLHSNSHLFIFQWNAKFWNLSRTVTSWFYNKAQNFENCTQTAIRFLQRNTKFWKLYPKGHSYFSLGNTKSSNLSSNFLKFRFLKNGKSIKIWFRGILFCFFTLKDKHRSIIEL